MIIVFVILICHTMLENLAFCNMVWSTQSYSVLLFGLLLVCFYSTMKNRSELQKIGGCAWVVHGRWSQSYGRKLLLFHSFDTDRITAGRVWPEKFSLSSSTESIRIVENLLLQILLEPRRIEIGSEKYTIETMNNGILFKCQKCDSPTICKWIHKQSELRQILHNYPFDTLTFKYLTKEKHLSSKE